MNKDSEARKDAKLVARNRAEWAGSAFLLVNQWIYDCGPYQENQTIRDAAKKKSIRVIVTEAKAAKKDGEKQKTGVTVASVENEMKGLRALWDLYQGDTRNKLNRPTPDAPEGLPKWWSLKSLAMQNTRAKRGATATRSSQAPLSAGGLDRVTSGDPQSHHELARNHSESLRAYPISSSQAGSSSAPAARFSGLRRPPAEEEFHAAKALQELAHGTNHLPVQHESYAQEPASDRRTPSVLQAPFSQGEGDSMHPSEGPNSSRSIGHMHSTSSALRRNKYFPIARALASQRF
ncbi:hypothetical protein T439DRAFT_336684 [Meredithblackwellia eburnea MCA 4105]